MNKSPAAPRSDSDSEKKVRDPDQWLELLRKLAANHSPYWAWEAIRVCKKYKKPFPAWLTDYLGECADRMLSDKARRASDVRKTFQWIFGFPKNKPGPGGLFNQNRGLLEDVKKGLFALNFAIRLYQGEDPAKARRNAGHEVFDLIDDKTIDDRTLQRFLLERFQLKNLPLATQEWMPVLDQYLPTILERLVSFNR
jgi:hypothetical protein